MNRTDRVTKLEQQQQPKIDIPRILLIRKIVGTEPVRFAHECGRDGQKIRSWEKHDSEAEREFMDRVCDEVDKHPGENLCRLLFSGEE